MTVPYSLSNKSWNWKYFSIASLIEWCRILPDQFNCLSFHTHKINPEFTFNGNRIRLNKCIWPIPRNANVSALHLDNQTHDYSYQFWWNQSPVWSVSGIDSRNPLSSHSHQLPRLLDGCFSQPSLPNGNICVLIFQTAYLHLWPLSRM